jgi:hypothetical protein
MKVLVLMLAMVMLSCESPELQKYEKVDTFQFIKGYGADNALLYTEFELAYGTVKEVTDNSHRLHKKAVGTDNYIAMPIGTYVLHFTDNTYSVRTMYLQPMLNENDELFILK